MLVDAHCHIDSYPQPALTLDAGDRARVATLAVTTSLNSYVRTRILCRRYEGVQVALGLHPRRLGGAYHQWAEWKQVLQDARLVGEVGLDFQDADQERRAAQRQTLEAVAVSCAREGRALLLHSAYAEAEAWEVIFSRQVQWVVWHGYRPEAPRSLLFRAIEAGHFLSLGPEALQQGAMVGRLRSIPREQVLTETNGPMGSLGTHDRAAALQQVLAALADAWRCSPRDAEAQVERNYRRLLAGVGLSTDL